VAVVTLSHSDICRKSQRLPIAKCQTPGIIGRRRVCNCSESLSWTSFW